MRKLLFVVVALGLAAIAFGQRLYGVTYYPTSQTPPLNGSDCSTTTLGLDISNSSGWAVTLLNDAGVTFEGVGAVQCYFCAASRLPVTAGGTQQRTWARCNTAFDVTPTAALATVRSADFQSSVGAGRVYYWPASVPVDGGFTGPAYDGGFFITIEGRRTFGP